MRILSLILVGLVSSGSFAFDRTPVELSLCLPFGKIAKIAGPRYELPAQAMPENGPESDLVKAIFSDPFLAIFRKAGEHELRTRGAFVSSPFARKDIAAMTPIQELCVVFAFATDENIDLFELLNKKDDAEAKGKAAEAIKRYDEKLVKDAKPN